MESYMNGAFRQLKLCVESALNELTISIIIWFLLSLYSSI